MLSLLAGALGTGGGEGVFERRREATVISVSMGGGSSPGGGMGEALCAGGGAAVSDEFSNGEGRIGCFGDGTCNNGVFIRRDFGGSPAKSNRGESG